MTLSILNTTQIQSFEFLFLINLKQYNSFTVNQNHIINVKKEIKKITVTFKTKKKIKFYIQGATPDF